ncbi:ABC transporter permease [Alicyclobacillus ferrooxydans]|uniref:Peptide ABC transporter n=1 Tax=Alicyclobacillus ferrooxydans TaxID=471514 RepID=A0A0P9CXU1_9BACL|nr:ABC transporter permease [Alicyclobacillus ferrooxydans]KPV44586.1 peptide ABC transporter [Alicyclobacillus ferrooxydans]
MAYVAKRIIIMIPVLFFLSVMVFSLIHLIPGDPAQIILGQDATPQSLAALRAQLGLNQPLPMQYIHWLGMILQGNLGYSLLDHTPVSTLIMQRLPVTVELAIGTVIVAFLISFPLGILAAVKRDKWEDFTALIASTIGLSVPPFWIGILFLLFFTVKIHLFPSSGYVPIWKNPGQNLSVMILPMVATGIREAAVLLRMLRSSLLDVIDHDFVRTARAKGLRGWTVIVRHALKNAMIPVITTGGLQIAGLLGGLVITEEIFSLPGFGSLLVNSVFSRDYTTVQACALIAALLVVVVNLLVDLVYGLMDPRIRLQRGKS